MAIQKGIRIHQYLDDWLVRATSHRECLLHTQVLVKMCLDLGWMVNTDKSELEPKQIFNFVGYQFDLQSRRVRPTPDRWQNLQGKILELLAHQTCSVREFMSLIGLITAMEKTGSPRQVTHEAHPMASQKQLEDSRIPRKEDSSAQVSTLPPTMVAAGKQCPHWPTIGPNAACFEGWGIKRRVGRSLKRVHCQWNLVPSGKLARTQGGPSGLKRFSRSLRGQDGSCSNRQHHGSSLHQQRGRYEVWPTLCPILEHLDLVHQQAGYSEGTTHSQTFECGGRQIIQTGSDHSDRMVSPPTSLSKDMPKVAPTSDRPVCHKVQQQAPPLCFTGSGPQGHCNRCTQPSLGGLDAYAFPLTAILGKVVEKLQDCPCKRLILIAPGWPNMTWFWDLVEMSSQIPLLLPQMPDLLTQPFNQTSHRSLPNLNLYAWLLEPQLSRGRVSLRWWQQELRLLKEDQPDQSMRQSGPF